MLCETSQKQSHYSYRYICYVLLFRKTKDVEGFENVSSKINYAVLVGPEKKGM